MLLAKYNINLGTESKPHPIVGHFASFYLTSPMTLRACKFDSSMIKYFKYNEGDFW